MIFFYQKKIKSISNICSQMFEKSFNQWTWIFLLIFNKKEKVLRTTLVQWIVNKSCYGKQWRTPLSCALSMLAVSRVGPRIVNSFDFFLIVFINLANNNCSCTAVIACRTSINAHHARSMLMRSTIIGSFCKLLCSLYQPSVIDAFCKNFKCFKLITAFWKLFHPKDIFYSFLS